MRACMCLWGELSHPGTECIKALGWGGRRTKVSRKCKDDRWVNNRERRSSN